jgi:formamidopyrimidine-DNA glycosylase
LPELPEAETVRRGLAAETKGATVASAVVTGRRSVRRHDRGEELGERLTGRTVTGLRRVGKVLLIDFDGGASGETAVVHLGMSAQLLWAAQPMSVRPRHTHVVLAFETGAELLFVDPRTFGQIYLSAGSAPPSRSVRPRPVELAHMGPDPLVDPWGPEAFTSALRSRQSMLKALLMDQRFLAGLGNIYSDEVLHAAKLRYDRKASSLTEDQAVDLHHQIRRILASAIRLGGSSLSDMQYRDVYGRPGRYQERHQVFAREGRPCPTCATGVLRQAWSGRSTFYCPSCQV